MECERVWGCVAKPARGKEMEDTLAVVPHSPRCSRASSPDFTTLIGWGSMLMRSA
jgi:hypothetical protein